VTRSGRDLCSVYNGRARTCLQNHFKPIKRYNRCRVLSPFAERNTNRLREYYFYAPSVLLTASEISRTERRKDAGTIILYAETNIIIIRWSRDDVT